MKYYICRIDGDLYNFIEHVLVRNKLQPTSSNELMTIYLRNSKCKIYVAKTFLANLKTP